MKWYHFTIIGLVFLLIMTRFPSPKVKGTLEIIGVISATCGVFFLGKGSGRYEKETK